ncbi:FecR family protein [Bacteroides sp. 51]|uniref:FecR family protein n=1 Tax=Bacteroides sp. 51 TaxID=2302938 RepID=UPI0013D5ACDB|nr:FecR family protein [Bacteroides sp. 51]NDV82214.1 FecR family protein [Bacteroides sp. 51]
MNQIILHKYFKGIVSQKEEELILEWVEASEENRKVFQKERMLYDISLFSNEKQQTKVTKNGRILYMAKWSFRVAASVLIILSCGLLFNEYKYSQSSQIQAITVPAGQRAEIVLADGTKVWLNARSTLTYAANFGKDSRNVELDGEAYFEVVKNSKMPFFVNTEHNKIKVVGTSFNVSAYQGSNEFETTLVEGIVDIYNREDDKMITRLTKDQFFAANGGNYQKKYLHSYEFLRWKEGLYCFDDTPFKCLLDKLEKYYSVNITVERPNILDYQCTGKFKENDGIEHILKVIQKDHIFSYTINENKDSIVIR